MTFRLVGRSAVALAALPLLVGGMARADDGSCLAVFNQRRLSCLIQLKPACNVGRVPKVVKDDRRQTCTCTCGPRLAQKQSTVPAKPAPPRP